ncbi:MAG: hypothetical protein HC798_02935, partial [Polaribacter sp.]|nr:hypothetical protein [Polaribacter sp.]
AMQIGIYFLITGFLTKQIIDGFVADGNTMGMLSVQLIEIIVLFLVLTFFFLAMGAIYFKNKRVANKNLQSLWSVKNKMFAAKFLFGF